MQGVTLGGTGKEAGDRHPKIRRGVLVGAGAKILGNIEIGHCSRVAACSVVLHDVPADTTVFGVPAHGARGGTARAQLDHDKMPDFCGEEMRRVQAQIDELKKELAGK